jgi:hypothetical protein
MQACATGRNEAREIFNARNGHTKGWLGLLRFDEFVETLYFCFAAKNALTFPRKSTSAFSLAFSASAFWCSSPTAGTRSSG